MLIEKKALFKRYNSMRLRTDTKLLNFYTSESSQDVDLILINQTTNQVTYDKVMSMNKQGYISSIYDDLGFNLTDENSYIMEVRAFGCLIYRATIEVSDTDKYFETKTINTDNDYITI